MVAHDDIADACVDQQAQPMVLRVVETQGTADCLSNASFEINEPYCILGSDQLATLPINEAGLESQHCEIVRNPAGTFVRDLADQLSVNGQPLREAWLHQGDLLQIGDIAVQVDQLGTVSLAPKRSWQTAPVEQPSTDSPNVPCPLDSVQDDEAPSPPPAAVCPQAIQSMLSPPSNENRMLPVDDETQSHNELSPQSPTTPNWHEPTIDPTHEQTPTDPQPNPETDLYWTEEDEEAGQHAQWLDNLYEVATADDQVPEANHPQTGDSISEPLQSETESQDDSNSSWLESSTAPVADFMRPGTDPQQFSDMPHPTREQTDKVLDQIESTFVEPQEQASETTMNSELDAQPTEEPTQRTQFEAPNKNESVAEVLARLQQSGKLDQPLPLDFGNDANVENAAANPAFPVEDNLTRAQQPAIGNADANDDSVQDYMSQLFERLRDGEPVGDSASPTNASNPDGSKPPTPMPAPDRKTNDDECLEPANPLTASEYKPSRSTAIQKSTLDALRQLANQSVHSALQVSASQKKYNTGLIYLGGSGVSLCISIVLLIMSQSWFDMCFILSIFAAVGCACLTFLFLRNNVTGENARKWVKEFKDKKGSSTKKPNATDATQSKGETESADVTEPAAQDAPTG